MSLSVDINTADLVRVERLIRSALSVIVPSGNFKEGSFLNDIVVRAMAVIPAIVETEAMSVRNRQSLLEIVKLPVGDVDSALDSLVSNWFVTRKEGTYSTTTATIHFSSDLGEVLEIPGGTQFTFSSGNQFVLNSSGSMILNRDENLLAVHDADGSVSEYIFYAPLISTEVGSTSTLYPGRFERVDAFSPYMTYAELEVVVRPSGMRETNEDLANRAKSSLSERGLTSARSIRAVLRDEYADVLDAVVIGAGAAEMQRDLVVNSVFGVNVHVLGHVNVYTLLPLVSSVRVVLGTVAAGVSTVTVPTTALHSMPFLRITRVLEGATALTRMSTHTIVVSGVTKYVTYNADTKEYTTSVSAVLPANAYSLLVADTDTYCSMEQGLSLAVGNTVGARTYTVEYTGVRNLYPVHLLLKDRDRRVVSANALAYSLVPAVISMSISLYRKPLAPAAFPAAEAKVAICAFINGTLHTNGLRVTDIVMFILSNYSLYVQGVVLPLAVNYSLQSPSGSEIPYTTQDKITVENMALLVNSGAYSLEKRVSEQVSDATVRFVAFEDLIEITELL